MSDSTGVLVLAGVMIGLLITVAVVDRPLRGRHRDSHTPARGIDVHRVHPRPRRWWRRRGAR